MAKLYFYYSAMNAGKSTMLLQASYNYKERGMEALIYIPAMDDRYQYGKVFSRIGLEAKAFPFDESFNLFQAVSQLSQKNKNIKCVLIDEAQFLKKAQVKQLTQIVDELNLPVLAFGLRTDFRGEIFEGSLFLLSWADTLSEIKTICHCGRKAIMNMRVDLQGHKTLMGHQIEIGGNERYVSVCRKHFNEADIS